MTQRTRSRHSITPAEDARGKYAAVAVLFAILGALALAASFSGCRHVNVGQVVDVIGDLTKPPTGTTQPPSTTVPPAACAPLCVGENQTGCKVEPAPGVCKHVCSTPWIAGGITLVDRPEQCPAPPVTPDPPVIPPVVTPSGPCAILPGDNYELLPRIPPTAAMVAHLSAAMAAVSGVERCDGSCRSGALTYQTDLDRVVVLLQGLGYCAGRQVAGAPEIAVQAKGSEEVWTFQPYEMGGFRCMCPPSASEPPDRWRLKAPPVPECLSLSWIKLELQDGKAKRHINATPQHKGYEDCMGISYAGRGDCPLGPEGSSLRPMCEAKHKPYTWTVTPDPGWDLAPEQDTGLPNPLVIKLEARQDGTVKVCSAEGVCGELVTQAVPQ